MAISIQKSPDVLSPVYNELVIVVTSDNATQPNFNFVADIKAVYDDASIPDKLLAVVKFPVNPEGYGVLDIHKHLQTQVTNDFNPTTTDVNYAPKTFVKYKVEFKEEFRPEWDFYNNIGPTQLSFLGNTDPSDYLSVGDEIVVTQAAGFTNPAYNGITTIASFYYDAVLLAYVIRTTKTFKTNTFNAGGVIRLSNYNTVRTAVLATFNDGIAFNGVETFNDYIDWNYTIYDAAGLGKFVTELGTSTKVRSDSKVYLNMFSRIIDRLDYVKILIGGTNYYLLNSYTGGTRDFFNVALGPNQINASNLLFYNGSSFVSATQPVIAGSVTEYTVSVVIDPTTPGFVTTVSPITFHIEESCSKYEDIQLVAMDKLGSFIPFHFDLVNRNTKQVKRTNYQTDYGKYASASNSWNYKDWDRGTRVLDTEVTDTFTITSNWVSQDVGDLMLTVVDSPEVYWVQSDGTTVAISLTVNNIERKQVINDQLINYTFSFNLANKNKKQLG